MSEARRARLAGAAALAAAAFALPADAALFDDDEARRRIETLRSDVAQMARDTDARLLKLEEQVRNIGVVELLRQRLA